MAFAGYMAAEALGFAGGVGTVVGGVGGFAGNLLGRFRFGDKLKKISPISDYKISCWRESLGRELDKLRKDCREQISQEIDRIDDNYSKSLESAKHCTENDIIALHHESHNLTIWAKQLDGSRKDLQKTVDDLDTLLDEYVFAVIIYKTCKVKRCL